MRIVTVQTISILALISVQIRANDIYPSQEFYNATLMPKPPTIDGNLADWAGVPVISDPRSAIPKGSGTNGTYVIFEPYSGGIWTGPNDWTSAFQIAWDANNLYVGITVTDDTHESLATGPSSAWNGDSVQLMIADGTRTQQLALYNYGMGGQDGALGEVYIHDEAGATGQPAPSVTSGIPTQAAVIRDAAKQRTYYEIQLPVEAMGLTPPLKAGMKIGLGVCINDGDITQPGQADQTGQKGWGGWGTHSIVFGKTPAQTGLLTLVTNQPTVDRLFFAAVDAELTFFSFRVTDKGASILDATSVKLIIDSQTVPLTASPKQADVTDFKYTNATPYVSGSTHSYTIQAKDTAGNLVTSSNTFTAPVYVTLPVALLVPAASVDKSKPGFSWEMSEVDSVGTSTQNSTQRIQDQLAGLLGPNTADPNAQGVALAAGKPNTDPNLPVVFEIPQVISLERYGNSWGAFTAGQMPGSPGISGSTDNQAARLVTYIDLPAGLITMGVNSDDGFVTGVGPWNDVFTSQVLGQFGGGRAAAATEFSFFVPQAGVYPFLTLWENGTGDSRLAWYWVKPDKTIALINDSANGGLNAYRAVTTAAKAGARSVAPPPNGIAQPGDPLQVQLVDGASPIDKTTVSLKLDNTAVAASITKTGSVTTVTYALNLAPQSTHTATLLYTESGAVVTRQWQFTAAAAGVSLLDFEFNEGSGTKATDSINKLVATTVDPANPPTFVTDTPSGKAGDTAIHFEQGQYMLAPDSNTVVRLNPNDPSFTLQAWVKFTGSPAGRMVFFYSNGPGGAISFSVNTDRTVFVTTLGVLDVASQAAIPDDGAWHHIAVIHVNLKELRFYVDGARLDTRPYTGSVIFTRTENSFSIGAQSTGTLQYIGSLDRLKVTSGILAPDQLDFRAAPPAGAPKLSGSLVAGKLNLTFEGTLQEASVITGPWADVPGTSPMSVATSGPMKFYRAKR